MSAVEDAVRRQISLQKPRNTKVTVDPYDNEQSPDEDMHQAAIEDATNTGDIYDSKQQPVQGALTNLGKTDTTPKPSGPEVQGRKPHPDPYIERGLRVLGELDLHNADHASEIDRLEKTGLQHPQHQKEYEAHHAEMERNNMMREKLLKGIQGLSDVYYEKGQKPPEEANNVPGFWSKTGDVLKTIGRGALDTAKYVGQHPIEALKDIGRGPERLGSLPFRVAAAAMPEGTPGKGLVERFHTGREEELAKSHEAAGVPRGETGPAVMEAVGEAALPVGPTIKAGQMLRNVVKGGGTTAGIYAGEQTANKQDITPEGLAGSAAVGGGLAGILGKLVGRGQAAKAAAKESGSPDAGATGSSDMPPGSGPVEPAIKQITNQQKQITAGPTTQPGGVINAEAPYKQLPAPPQAEGSIPAGAVEVPTTDFGRQFSKVWRTPDGSLIGETRGGEIIRADKQPTPLSAGGPGEQRSQLQRLIDAKRQQQNAVANQAPGAQPPQPSGAGAMPEQPFSGQPKPGLDLTAKPLPGAQPPQPSPLQQVIPPKPPAAPPAAPVAKPQMQPAASAQPAPQPQVMGPPQAGAPPLKVVNPTPQAQANVGVLRQLIAQKQQAPQPTVAPQPAPQPVAQAPQPSMLKQIIPGAELAPQPQAPKITEKSQPQFKPKNTSAKVGTTEAKPQVPAGKNVDMVKWARREGYTVREFAGSSKVEIRDPNTGEKLVEFSDTPSRNKAAEHFQKQIDTDEKNTIKLYSGVDVGEAWTGMKKFGKFLKREGSYFFPEGRGERLSPIHGLKTGAAIERGGGVGGQVSGEMNEAERAAHKMVEDLRYKQNADESYSPTKFEVGLNMSEEPRVEAAKSILDFEKINMRPGDGKEGSFPEKAKYDEAMKAYNNLTPIQKESVQGVWDFADDVRKAMNEELRVRVLTSKGKKTGLVTPKEMKEFIAELPEEERMALSSIDVGGTGTGYKRAYYPHRFEGNFEVHEIDPGSGVETGKKFIRPFEGAREGEGSSTVKTMRDARKFKDEIATREGISADRLKIVMPKQAGGSKYLEERKGVIGYEQEHKHVFQNYLDYAHEVAHWVQMSKLSRVVNDMVGSSTFSEADKSFILNKWLPRVAGKQATQDMWLNNLVKRVPIVKDAFDPYAPASQIMKGARQFTTATALGVFNAASALVNADGVARHVWPALARLANELKLPAFSAEKYGASAIKAWTSSTSQTAINKLGEFDRTKAFASQLSEALNLNQANKNLLQKMAHEGVLDIQIFGERLAPSEKKAERGMRMMLAMFATTEDFSRGVASVAAYRMARDAGLTEAQALQKAFQLTSSALGRYSKAGKPMVYSSELGGTLGIFKTYLHVMLDNAYLNMRHPVKDFGAFSRYALAALGISGLTGLYPGTQDIDSLATAAFGKSPQAWLHKNLPLWVVDGIPTLFGTDLSSRAGAPEVVPNKGEDWLGAVYSKVAKPIGSLVAASYQNTLRASQGEPTSFLQDILPALKQAAPNTVGLRYLLSESEDSLKGSRERTIIKNLTPEEKTIKALGLPLNREVQARQQYQVGENLKSKWTEERKRLVDLFLNQDESTVNNWGALSHKYAITPRMLREEAKRKNQTLSERQRKSMPKPLRQEVRDWDTDF